jgi:hypothetical protein
MLSRTLVALVPLALAATGLQPDPRAELHHLHLGAPGAVRLASVYARLFAPGAVQQGTFWGAPGIKGGGAHLLVDDTSDARPEDSTLWHFGWGQVSLGETYRDHFVKEVNWRPPYPALTRDLHVHLRSRRPHEVADWYGRVLGGDVQKLLGWPHEEERVDALVRFATVVLAIHAVGRDEPFPSSRGRGRLDHLAFAVADPGAVLAAAGDRRRVELPPAPADTTGRLPSLDLDGPDGVVIELVRRARAPAFWER